MKAECFKLNYICALRHTGLLLRILWSLFFALPVSNYLLEMALRGEFSFQLSTLLQAQYQCPTDAELLIPQLVFGVRAHLFDEYTFFSARVWLKPLPMFVPPPTLMNLMWEEVHRHVVTNHSRFSHLCERADESKAVRFCLEEHSQLYLHLSRHKRKPFIEIQQFSDGEAAPFTLRKNFWTPFYVENQTKNTLVLASHTWRDHFILKLTLQEFRAIYTGRTVIRYRSPQAVPSSSPTGKERALTRKYLRLSHFVKPYCMHDTHDKNRRLDCEAEPLSLQKVMDDYGKLGMFRGPGQESGLLIKCGNGIQSRWELSNAIDNSNFPYPNLTEFSDCLLDSYRQT